MLLCAVCLCCFVSSAPPCLAPSPLKLDLEYRRSQALLTAIKQKASNSQGRGGLDRFGRPTPAKVPKLALSFCMSWLSVGVFKTQSFFTSILLSATD